MRERLQDPDLTVASAALTLSVNMLEVCYFDAPYIWELTHQTGWHHVGRRFSPNPIEATPRNLAVPRGWR